MHVSWAPLLRHQDRKRSTKARERGREREGPTAQRKGGRQGGGGGGARVKHVVRARDPPAQGPCTWRLLWTLCHPGGGGGLGGGGGWTMWPWAGRRSHRPQASLAMRRPELQPVLLAHRQPVALGVRLHPAPGVIGRTADAPLSRSPGRPAAGHDQRRHLWSGHFGPEGVRATSCHAAQRADCGCLLLTCARLLCVGGGEGGRDGGREGGREGGEGQRDRQTAGICGWGEVRRGRKRHTQTPRDRETERQKYRKTGTET